MVDIWSLAAILSKLALYVGAFGAAGLVMSRLMFARFLTPLSARMRVQTVFFAALALVAAILGFMLQGAALTGGLDGMTDPEILGLLWQTPVGDVLIFRLIGGVLIVLGICLDGAGQRFGAWLALAGATLALWSFAMIGHVPDLPQTGIRVLLCLHLFGIAFWIGILAPLRRLSARPEYLPQAALLGHRFGQVAAAIVPLLIVAGVAMAWALLGDVRLLLETGYGQALLLKLSLVALVLTLAAANKLRFVPAMLAGDSQAARHLTRSIEIEAGVILLALASTATLTSVLTPSA